MAVLPPAQGIARAVFNFVSNDIPTANVLHFAAPPGPDSPDPEYLASDLTGWWITNMKPLTTSGQQLTSVVVTDLSAGGAPAFEHTTGLPSSGVATGEAMPNMVCGCISLRTALRGRSYRGRIYVGGMTESQVAANTITSTWRTAVLTAYEKLIVFVTAPLQPDSVLGVLSYYSDGAVRAVPVFTPVVSMTMDPKPDTQRRRMH